MVFVKRVFVILGCSKRLIKQVQHRINLLKTKRHAIVRQLREDVALLIKAGHENIAFNRVSIRNFFSDIVSVLLAVLLLSVVMNFLSVQVLASFFLFNK